MDISLKVVAFISIKVKRIETSVILGLHGENEEEKTISEAHSAVGAFL